MKQTAVEWLIEQIKEYDFSPRDNTYLIEIPSWILKERIEQAKELEKQQIIDAWNDVYGHIKDAEQYYNETFKSKNITLQNDSESKVITEISDEEIEKGATISEEAKERAKNYMRLKGALEPKQETLEEAAEKYANELPEPYNYGINLDKKKGFIEGAKWQAERSYSEEDLISFAHFYFQEEFNSTMQTSKSTDEIFKEWFEQFKKKQ